MYVQIHVCTDTNTQTQALLVPTCEVEGPTVSPLPGSFSLLVGRSNPNRSLSNLIQHVLLLLLACDRCQMSSFFLAETLGSVPTCLVVPHPQEASPIELLPTIWTDRRAGVAAVCLNSLYPCSRQKLVS